MAKKAERKRAPRKKVHKGVLVDAGGDAVSHQEDPLLSFSEAGKMLGVTGMTIGRWVNDGLLNCVRLPSGLLKVRRSQCEAHLTAKNMVFHNEPERSA